MLKIAVIKEYLDLFILLKNEHNVSKFKGVVQKAYTAFN